MPSGSLISLERLIGLGLVLMVLVGYWPVREAGFINLDDPYYVNENPRIREGLTWKGVVWALKADLVFDSPYADYWQPVTFLSRMTDIELFGLDASWHHVENVLIHALNTLLLFGVLRWLTGSVWRSGVVAAVFAVHPLHVEAVAWVTERKEVLGGLFWMLTLWAYGWYVRRPGAWRYVVVTLVLVLGLMSKPVGMVLPVILLLLDVWPLGRLKSGRWMGLVWEKAPWMGLAMASMWVTLRTQVEHLGGAWGQVMGTVVMRYGTYLVKAVAPTGLAVWHPPPEELSEVLVAGSLGGLVLVTAWCWCRREERPYCLVGWLWFGVGLVPVITLWDTAWAERFMYLPLVGLAVMVAWALPEGWFAAGWRRRVGGAAVGAVVAGMLMGTWRQAGYWKDSLTLYERALEVSGESWIIHDLYAKSLAVKGRNDEAFKHFAEVARLVPALPEAQFNLGTFLLNHRHQTSAAIVRLKETLRLQPKYPEACGYLGIALSRSGKNREAVRYLEEALRLKPSFFEAHYNLGIILAGENQSDRAIVHFAEALRLRPDHAEAHNNLGFLLAGRGRHEEAVSHFRRAVWLRPNYVEAHYNLGSIRMRKGQLSEAMTHLREAVCLNPGLVEARFNLALLLKQESRTTEAIQEFTETLRLRPDFADAHYELGTILAIRGEGPAAKSHFEEVIRSKPRWAPALVRMAWLLATDPDPKVRCGFSAMEMAERACKETAHQDAAAMASLAAAYAEMGRFQEAVATANRSIKLARSTKNENLVKRIQQQMTCYRQQRPCRGIVLSTDNP